MKARILLVVFSVAAFLLSACESEAPPLVPTPTSFTSGGSVQLATPSAASPSPVEPSPTTTRLAVSTATPPAPPTATIQPPPSPTLPSPVISPGNISQITQIFDYWDAFVDATGITPLDVRLSAFDFALDGRSLAIGICSINDSSFICDSAADNDVLILDTQTGRPLQYLRLGKLRMADLALTPDGSLVYTLQTDRASSTTVQAWDVKTGQLDHTLFDLSGDVDTYPHLCLSPNDNYVAASISFLGFIVFERDNHQKVFEAPGQFGFCAFSPDGQRLFAIQAGTSDSSVIIYDTASWETLAQIDINAEVAALAVAPDGQAVAVSEGAQISVWEVAGGGRITSIQGPDGADWSFGKLAFSPDGRLLVGLVRDYYGESLLHFATAWETREWQVASDLQGMSLSPLGIRFNARGDQFFVFDWGGGGQLYGLPDDYLIAARQTLTDYLDALNMGDYKRAAQLFTFDPLSEDQLPDWIRSQGGDPEDMASTFELACRPDAFPCLALRDIRFAGRIQGDTYLFIITLAALDGSTFVSPDSSSDFWLYAITGEDGQIRMLSLPPGAFSS